MEKQRSTSFGRYLKTVRLEKGIRLSAISSQTRISKDTLQALEEEDHDRLPADVFVKGFIRAHARVVGADGDAAIRGYVESRRLVVERSGHPVSAAGSRPQSGMRRLILGGILVVIVGAVVWGLQAVKPVETDQPETVSQPPETAAVKEETPPAEPQTQSAEPLPAQSESTVPAGPEKDYGPEKDFGPDEKPAAAEDPAVGEKPAAGPIMPKESAVSAETVPRARQRIHLEVVEDTWLKVIVDSLTTKEYSLAPGDTLELEADKGFNLLIGNAAGLKLTFNDDPVTIPGKSGQVVTIQLP